MWASKYLYLQFRHLAKFFDCLAHPNLNALIENDPKAVFVSLTKV